MYPNKCYYVITGFAPPSEGMEMGGYGFAIGLKAEFAKKCLNYKLKKENTDRLNLMGLERIKRVFSYGDRNPFYFHDMNDEWTMLLRWVQVPGNACDIGDGGLEPKDILNMNDNDFIEFQPHNVDGMKQAYTLLSLWLKWFDCAFACVMDTQTANAEAGGKN